MSGSMWMVTAAKTLQSLSSEFWAEHGRFHILRFMPSGIATVSTLHPNMPEIGARTFCRVTALVEVCSNRRDLIEPAGTDLRNVDGLWCASITLPELT